MTPAIVTHTHLRFVGLKAVIRDSSRSPNDMRKVPTLWKELAQIAPTLTTRLGAERYAMITGDLPNLLGEEACYYALFAMSDFTCAPENLVKVEYKNVRLATFKHRGAPENVGATVYDVLQNWLPASGEKLASNTEMFIYPAGYDRTKPDGEFEVALFLESR